MMKTRTLCLLALIILAVIYCSNIVRAEKGFTYVFEVDAEGYTSVTVLFYDNKNGSSWLLVPKAQREDISLMVNEGRLVNVTYRSLVEKGKEDPFYVIMEFEYEASRIANITIRYFMEHGALIIEPKAVFISPRVTHEGPTTTRVLVHLPSYATVSRSRVSSFSGFIRNVEVIEGKGCTIVGAIVGPDDRIVVEYTVPFKGNITHLTANNFTFRTASRYLRYAYDVLETLNDCYPIYEKLFENKLYNVEVEFFVPSIEELMLGIEGYVPFLGDKLGAIHLNLLYIRGVKGFMDIIAMHELAHHFLWSIGVPPSKLWIHEGIAEYISLALGLQRDYYDAVEIHESLLTTVWNKMDNYLGFIQKWTPFYVPSQDLRLCYAASYYIFKTLCDRYGGLEYLKSLFKAFRDIDWNNDTQVIEAFGIAAGDVNEVFKLFREWGFELEESSQLVPSLSKVKRNVSGMPTWLKPYRDIAQAVINVAEVFQQYDLPYLKMLAVKTSQIICETSWALAALSFIIVITTLVILVRRSA
ncbi:MAG: hypothetical protein QW701_03775 [Candidatus Nezhaarchaeales archaeon]